MKLQFLIGALALSMASAELHPALIAADKSAAAPVSPADAHFVRFIEASGGEPAIRKRTTRQTKGRISIPSMGINGSLEILQSATGKTVQTFELGPGVTFAMGSDGAIVWMKIPGLGVQEMEGDQRRQFVEDSDLYRMLNLSSRFTRKDVKGPKSLGAVECDVVVGTTKEGKTETFFFARSNGLLIRWDREILTQTGAWAPGETWLEDYRTVDGLKVPFKIRQMKPDSDAFEIEIHEIRHGVPVPDNKFTKPAA